MAHRCSAPRSWRLAFWLSTLALGIAPSPAFAASPGSPADTIFSARKAPESSLKTTRAVTVITSEDMERWGAKFVADALRHVPGVYVRRAGGIGRATTAIIRGSSAGHVLVLIDGVQVNSATTGAFDFAHLTTDNLERIEVLRGGASPLYGSEAVGGVISIFTKSGRETPGTSAKALGEFGSDRTFRESGEVQWTGGTTRTSTALSRIDSHGVSADDDYRNITVSGRTVSDVTDRLGVETAVRWHQGRGGIDDGAFLPDPNRRLTENQTIATTAVRQELTPWWQHHLQFSTDRTELIDLDQPNPGTTQSQSESRIVTKLYGAEWRHDLSWGEQVDVGTGFEMKSQQGDTGSFDQRVRTWALYAQPSLTIGPVTVVGGGRLFHHSTFGHDTTYELSAAYRITERGPKLRAGYAQGFHAPTLNDLYFPTFSNPNLKPETSDSYEIGVDHAWGDGRLTTSASLFHREVDGLIQFGGSIPENLGETEQKGAELEFSAEVGRGVSLQGHYTYVNAIEEPSGEELLRVPHATADLALRYVPITRLAFDLRWNFVGSREDVGRQHQEHYSLVDAQATLTLAQAAELYVRIENLFNREYQEIIGFPGHGFGVFFGGRVQL